MNPCQLALGAALLAGLLQPCAAQVDPPAGFALVGHVERFTLDTPASATSSAVMRVRGIDVVLPANLVITMPGGYLTAQQLFRGRSLAPGLPQPHTGLALADPPASACAAGVADCRLPPAEAELAGNIVDGRYVAGIARITQGALHVSAGFIRGIQADGTLLLGADAGAPQTPAVRVKLNDPEGIYGPKALGQDMRFALDPANAPVHARTGFPVCLPRSAGDALCPSANRPGADQPHHRRFTCGQHPAAPSAPVWAPCRPHLPVPLREGDYVTVVGRLDQDAQGLFVSAHGLDAELGVYTEPGKDPAYTFVEVAIQGTKGEPYPGFPQEETARFILVGFTSDPSRTVQVQLVDDQDHEAALEPRFAPDRLATRLVPTNGGQLGRYKMIWAAKDDARAVRRAIRVTLSPATQPGATAHAPGRNSRDLQLAGASRRGGYAFGTYESPISEYIPPEPTRFGDKGYAVPVNFENFCFLRRTNRLETLVPGTNGEPWVHLEVKAVVPSLSPRMSQVGSGNRRVCGD